jgi:hypothetical protein
MDSVLAAPERDAAFPRAIIRVILRPDRGLISERI